MPKTEPPSPRPPSRSHIFLVGKDRQGHWVAKDRSHLCGGLFANRHEAVKFALFENGHQAEAVVMVAGPLELDIGDSVHEPPEPAYARRAA